MTSSRTSRGISSRFDGMLLVVETLQEEQIQSEDEESKSGDKPHEENQMVSLVNVIFLSNSLILT